MDFPQLTISLPNGHVESMMKAQSTHVIKFYNFWHALKSYCLLWKLCTVLPSRSRPICSLDHEIPHCTEFIMLLKKSFLLFDQALQWLRTYETWDTTIVRWLTPPKCRQPLVLWCDNFTSFVADIGS